MAKEYIEREMAINAITVDGFEHFSGCLSSSEVRLLELMRDSLSEIPAADVVEVVHGRWEIVWVDDGHIGMTKMYKCTNCGGRVHNPKYPNCPWCTAKMNSKRKDDTNNE